MNRSIVAVLSIVGLVAGIGPVFAQDAVVPGTEDTTPLTQGTGSGLDSAITGYSESGRGGTGGMGGGATSNGTSDGAGTATGGNAGGYPDRE